LLALAVVLSPATMSGRTEATGCNVPIVVHMRFSPGQACWLHLGPATEIVGELAGGQDISIGAAGGEHPVAEADLVWAAHDPWQIILRGPGGSERFTANGVMRARLEASGGYSISLGPCAEWGTPGTVLVCLAPHSGVGTNPPPAGSGSSRPPPP
jgi:hypothetical protein